MPFALSHSFGPNRYSFNWFVLSSIQPGQFISIPSGQSFSIPVGGCFLYAILVLTIHLHAKLRLVVCLFYRWPCFQKPIRNLTFSTSHRRLTSLLRPRLSFLDFLPFTFQLLPTCFIDSGSFIDWPVFGAYLSSTEPSS